MKKYIAVLLILVIGVYVGKKTILASYVGTLWAQTKKDAREQVPTRFEIERARHEIGNLDGDAGNMIRPIAEYMADIARLKKDIQATQVSLDEQRPALLIMTKDLEDNPSFVAYGNEKFSAERVRTKLQRDFESYRRLESHLQSQKKLLQAKETSLRSAQDQLAKVMNKKHEYELRLAQLEADEETLQVARVGSKLQLDDSRATQIEAALADIEKRQNVQRAEIELKTGALANDNIPVQQRHEPGQDLSSIRRYLEDPASRAP